MIANNAAGAEVIIPADNPGAPARTNRRPVERITTLHIGTARILHILIGISRTWRLRSSTELSLTFDESQHDGLVISEVMWGEDVSLNPSSNSQYIELYNPGTVYTTEDDADHTPDVNEALTLIFYAPNEFNDVPAVDEDGALPAGITDRIGTLDATGAYWDPKTKGQSGSSGVPLGEC